MLRSEVLAIWMLRLERILKISEISVYDDIHCLSEIINTYFINIEILRRDIVPHIVTISGAFYSSVHIHILICHFFI